MPGLAPQRSSALVSSADIAPTVLGRAGLAPFRGIQGADLGGVLAGRSARVRSRLMVEEDQPFGIPGLPGPVRMRTLLTEQARLTAYGGHGLRELFDHETDADEVENLAGTLDGRQLEARMLGELTDELMCLADSGTRPVASA